MVTFCETSPHGILGHLPASAQAPLIVRDVWRQQDVATIPAEGESALLKVTVPAHDVVLYRVRPQ